MKAADSFRSGPFREHFLSVRHRSCDVQLWYDLIRIELSGIAMRHRLLLCFTQKGLMSLIYVNVKWECGPWMWLERDLPTFSQLSFQKRKVSLKKKLTFLFR